MSLRSLRELEATREKLRLLETRSAAEGREQGGDPHVRELSMRSMKRLIKQLIEEIARFESKEKSLMSLAEMLPNVQSLSRLDKIRLIQLLAQELEQDESDLIEPGRSYPIWSPDRAFTAAAAMLQALEEDRAKEDSVSPMLVQVNFFMEFDVCFFRARRAFALQPNQAY